MVTIEDINNKIQDIGTIDYTFLNSDVFNLCGNCIYCSHIDELINYVKCNHKKGSRFYNFYKKDLKCWYYSEVVIGDY